MKPIALRPEFVVLVRCCKWNFARAAEENVRPALPNNLNWDLVVSLARRHRVQGLVWNALAPIGQVPDEAAAALSSDARSIAATNLAIAGQCCALLKAFEEAQLSLLFVKGLSVAALAYQSPMLKMGWDIDLLIDPNDLAMAATVLHRAGYTLRLPANVLALPAWHARSKESVWHRDEKIHVELHTRLADNQLLIPNIDVHAPRQLVEVAPSVSLPTLADDELLGYLAVHGASSAWFRLKWIADFAALLAGRSGEDLAVLYDRSQQLGSARAFGQALLLADDLFETLQPNRGLRRHLASDRASAMLCRAALGIMTNGDHEPTERTLGTLSIHWTQFLLRPDFGFKLSELKRQARSLRIQH